jgi:long-chain acyl-CoA synthetase
LTDQLYDNAKNQPDKSAIVMSDTGQTITYGELDRLSNRIAQSLVKRGLRTNNVAGVLMRNCLLYAPIVFGIRRAGVDYTPISTHLSLKEILYVVRDAEVKCCFVGSEFTDVTQLLRSNGVDVITVGSGDAETDDFTKFIESAERTDDRPTGSLGRELLYSSGTTGMPKGIRRRAATAEAGLRSSMFDGANLWDLGPDMVFLSPGPLYHTAPLMWVLHAVVIGGTAIIMPRFDARGSLEAIDKYRVTHSQWVPTMFHRLFELDPALRAGFNLRSHRYAIHAAAPCPVSLKERLIAWWGEIVWEYYGGTEGNGGTRISPTEWLVRKGSVGRAHQGSLHIVSEDGNECAPGQSGIVYFDGPRFEYFKDPEKTASCYNVKGWSTIGDIGHVDQDGYLYLTDRRSHMIISGGVNIYPAEAENIMSEHPAVRDVGVFGIPNEEFGEEVKAAVVLKDGYIAGPELEAELINFCRKSISHIKCPRSIDFHSELPRQESGKLFKGKLRAPYLNAQKIETGRI